MTHQHVKNVINIQNHSNRSGYPLFLGEDLGFSDTINLTYPELEDLAKEQRGQYWTETEHSLAQDKLDFQEDPETGDIMIRNLMSQWLMDSVAARSIMSIIEPFVSNSEMIEVLSEWQYYENLHTRTYLHIMRNCFNDAPALLERAKADTMVAYRSKLIGKIFNETYQMAADYSAGRPISKDAMKKQLLRTFVALYSLEAISFQNSFACTFAITETGKFQSIGNDITAICKDEVVHAKFSQCVLNILRFKEGYEPLFQEMKDELREILIEACKQEHSFGEYIFSEGRSVVGCNTELLKMYTAFIAAPIFKEFGFEIPEMLGEIPERNPLPYMDKYLNPDMIQSAAQEITLTNYLVAKTVDDVSGKVFDF